MEGDQNYSRFHEDLLSGHIGALYSCPTELHLATSSVPEGKSNLGSFSARCFVPETQPSRQDETYSLHCDFRLRAEIASRAVSFSGDASVREIFCRTLSPRSIPNDVSVQHLSSQSCTASDTLAAATERSGDNGSISSSGVDNNSSSSDGNIDALHEALREALRPLYPGLGVVRSLRSRVPDDAVEPRGGDGDDGEVRETLATCTRLHAGLVPLCNPVVASEDGIFLMFSCVPFRLTALTQLFRGLRGTAGLSPIFPAAGGRRARDSVDLVVRFVFFQLLRVVDFLHSRGITVGNLSSSNILLTNHLWLQIAPSMSRLLRGHKQARASPPASTLKQSVLSNPSNGILRASGQSASRLGNPRVPPGEELPLAYRWAKGMVTNLEYLLAVNAAAGRVLGDRLCHPIIPWVSDLTCKMGEEVEEEGGGEGGGNGWRDLTMTKFRLQKGDAQLDKSYLEGKPPHHIPESLSELTFAVYLARRLPVQMLRDVVRSKVVAEEYPSSIARMYSWTPDECVPEFFTDPDVFRSAHRHEGGLPDLEVPHWCNGSPEEFVRYHRSLLESEQVSRNLHRWLDVTFGYCLKGQAAVDNKNVPLSRSGADRGTSFDAWSSIEGCTLSDKTRPGFIQLFRHPHPPRKPDQIMEDDPSRAQEEKRILDSRGGAREAVNGKSSGASGKGGGVSIFGVAFDDYIGEDGVCSSPASPAGVSFSQGAAGAVECSGSGGGGGTRLIRSESEAGGAGDTRATIEEDRRALAFAYDVELRLEPWYGRPRNRGKEKGLYNVDGGEDGDGEHSQAEDLLACGCVLSEMCAGEPVLAGPSSLGGTGGVGKDSCRGSWLDAAADLPVPLRGAIAALTHPNPDKRPSAATLLSTSDVGQDEGEDEGDPVGEGISYRGLFPPYMRDVYAFLAALHREDTVHKRLILAAAALPVLQVPLHAFYLLVPHLTTLLEVALTADSADASGGGVREVQSRSTRELVSKAQSVAGAAEAVERAWVDVLDLCSVRLGPSLASVVVLPAALKTLTGIRSPESACRLMEATDVWTTLAKRIGARTFLRRAFPILLGWLERGVGGGTDYKKTLAVDRNGRRGVVNGARRQGFDGSFSASPESDSAAECKVQMAAAASISRGLFECFGPTLSARYIVPALVDCLGRLAAAAASDSTASGRSSSSPPDPASRALLEILRSMGGDPDAGIGGGSAFLVLSQALGDVCMMIESEEVAVPVVVSRVFEQILPTLEPVLLSQSGGQSIAATVTATGLRSILEVTSLLSRLLPSLCPEIVSHFYVGMRPPPSPSSACTSDALTPEAAPRLSVEEVTSVPWLLTTMSLPTPLAGLDLPWSADRNDVADASVLVACDRRSASYEEDCRPPPQEQAVRRCSSVSAATADGEKLRFVCHVEVARLLAATALGVLREHEQEHGEVGCVGGVEEECSRILRAGEDFFAAFGRCYGGLVFSSPTMVAAMRLAREVYSPLASLFGFDVMRQRVPSVSPRMEAWLGSGEPRFGDLEILEGVSEEERGEGKGEVVVFPPVGSVPPSDNTMYISPAISSEDEESVLGLSGGSSREVEGGISPRPPQPQRQYQKMQPLFDRIQRAIKQRLLPETKEENGRDGRMRQWHVQARQGQSMALPDNKRAPARSLGPHGKCDTKERPSRGMPAWGGPECSWHGRDEIDAILPPPQASTLPLSPRFNGDREIEARDGSVWGSGTGRGLDDAAASALEWPSLLGAIGSRAPRAPRSPTPSTLTGEDPDAKTPPQECIQSLPGTCRGVGVEVRERLRDRAWLTGRRAWECLGRRSGRRRRRELGEGFRGDAVGSLFPLDMVLQTSFLAHPDKAPVTSMSIEARSESILLTGSGEGEVRVWSLRDHPVVRLSGFRSGDTTGGGGGGGRKSHAALRAPRAAVTQLGMFEGAGRAAALDGVIRVWDVERSKGLAICHQSNSADATPLTAFSLTGCGDGITPPLDGWEWGKLASGAGGSSFSAADDQQLAAAFDKGIVHFDCREGRQGDDVQNLFPVAVWDAEAQLESLRARLPSKSHADTLAAAKRGDPAALPIGLCTVCEGGEGSWLAAGSGGGQIVVFDKRRAGGRPIFWWNAHSCAVVGVFHISRNELLSVSRDRTAVLWDLSRSPAADISGIDSTGGVIPYPHTAWAGGAHSDVAMERASVGLGGGYGEVSPVRISAAIGLPESSPGIFPATVTALSLGRPPGHHSSIFGEGYGGGNGVDGSARRDSTTSTVLFAAAGERMVASVVRQDPGEDDILHPASFVGPSGETVTGKTGGRRFNGIAIRSVAVSPLRRLLLLGCGDGWVRVGT